MRPLGRSYLQHGQRHRKHGSDPIPGIEESMRWAMYSGFITAAASTSIQYVEVDQLTTNDPTLYDYGSGVSSHQIPQVNETGIYLITYTAEIGAATAGDRIQLFFSGDIGIVSGFNHGVDTIVFGTGGTGDSIDRTIGFRTARAVGGALGGSSTVPQSENPTVQNLTAARSFTANVHCLIQKIADGDYTTDGSLSW